MTILFSGKEGPKTKNQATVQAKEGSARKGAQASPTREL